MYEQPILFKNSNYLKAIRKVKENTERSIIDGISKRFSSTGTPIEDLHGASRITATVANIGGGAKRVGGNGMEGGIGIIRMYDVARSYLKAIDNKNNIFRKPVSFAKLLK